MWTLTQLWILPPAKGLKLRQESAVWSVNILFVSALLGCVWPRCSQMLTAAGVSQLDYSS